MKQNSLTLRLTALVVLILIPLTACGIRPNKLLDRDIVGTLESDTQIELVSDFTGPESVEPVTIPETGAPIETASPIIVPETVYSEETSAETDPSAIGSLPDYSHIWEFKPDPPEFYSKYPIPDEFFLSDFSLKDRIEYERRPEHRYEFFYNVPSATFPDGSPLSLPLFSILGDPNYIEKHTVGFYLIQNKRSGRYITYTGTIKYLTDPANYKHIRDDAEHFGMWDQDLSETNMAGAQIVRIVRLDNGGYALLLTFYAKDPDTDIIYFPCISFSNSGLMMHPWQFLLLDHTMLIRKTSSGAFRITTVYRDAVKIQHIEKDNEGKYVDKSFFATLVEISPLFDNKFVREGVHFSYPYVDDTDYSDEWLFIPVKGSPEFNP